MGGDVQKFVSHARAEIGKVIVGQEEVINQLLAVLICGGHALLEGVPGIAKTLAVKALAHICGLDFQRVQCTPDLMPADILGANVFNMATSTFTLRRGPVFTGLLLVDEVNRVPPRTQSALLEVHGGAPGYARRHVLSALPFLHGIRHPEPGGVRRHLPPAGSATGPLPLQDSRSLPCR